ncbi:MAG: hypothetical protein SWE60_10240 [Thermodesulfobacteriota bacterium]|nr:hypothetical protein [Thermodesulfobacteriota bacterium]
MSVDDVVDQPPSRVYLCQVSGKVSCAACCGLYNVADPSPEALLELLAYRTLTFETVARDIDSILAFKEQVEDRENQQRPFAGFHHCPFIGLVGSRQSRVGCLLHPSAHGNRGVDFRGLSFYGGMACRVYFCPSHYHLSDSIKQIVRKAAKDWYLYGLVITETEMLRAFFQEVERRLNGPIKEKQVLGSVECLKAFREFLQLKSHWPFRPKASKVLGNYFFEDKLYEKPPINYKALGETTSRYDPILRALASRFDSVSSLREAEALLDGLIDRAVYYLSMRR